MKKKNSLNIILYYILIIIRNKNVNGEMMKIQTPEKKPTENITNI